MNRKNVILGGVCVLALGFAAALFVRQMDPYASVPDDESTWVDFHCTKCGVNFHLTGRELQQELDRLASGPKGAGASTFRCKACGEQAAILVTDDS